MTNFLKFIGFLLGLLVCSSAHGDSVSLESIDGLFKLPPTQKVAHLYGVLDKDTVQLFLDELKETSLIPGPRVVMIHSPGGSVIHAQRAIDALMTEKRSGTRIICVADGQAMSMAFNLMSRCDLRAATEDSQLMFHRIYYSILIGPLTAPVLRQKALEVERDDNRYKISNLYALRMSSKQYDYHANKQTQWSATQLLHMGYLQFILSPKGLDGFGR